MTLTRAIAAGALVGASAFLYCWLRGNPRPESTGSLNRVSTGSLAPGDGPWPEETYAHTVQLIDAKGEDVDPSDTVYMKFGDSYVPAGTIAECVESGRYKVVNLPKKYGTAPGV